MEQEKDGEGVEEGEEAAEDGGQESAAGEKEWTSETVEGREERAGKGRAASGEEKRTSRSHQQRGKDDDARPKRKRVRGVGYREEQIGQEEQGAVREGVTVYGPHKVRGKWRMYVGTVEEIIEQQDPTGACDEGGRCAVGGSGGEG